MELERLKRAFKDFTKKVKITNNESELKNAVKQIDAFIRLFEEEALFGLIMSLENVKKNINKNKKITREEIGVLERVLKELKKY